jgi:hypothetical protein
MQMLMRPQVIVPNPKQSQRRLKLFPRIDLPAIKLLFQGSEETLDAPIQPGVARFGCLVFYVEQPQYDLKPLRLEERFIVGADDSGFAIAADHTNELLQQGQDRFVLQSAHGQIGPTGVFHNAEQAMGVTLTASLSC